MRLGLIGRLLEEGKLEAAEEHKQRIEQLQRDRRRVLEENNATHQPKFFRYPEYLSLKLSHLESHLWKGDHISAPNGVTQLVNLSLTVLIAVVRLFCLHRKARDDTWVSNNTYWELRKDPGFAHVDFPTLWWPCAADHTNIWTCTASTVICDPDWFWWCLYLILTIHILYWSSSELLP